MLHFPAGEKSARWEALVLGERGCSRSEGLGVEAVPKGALHRLGGQSEAGVLSGDAYTAARFYS